MSRRLIRGASLALLPLALSACSSEPTDPSAVTPEEESQLNDAAAMLDANSIALDEPADNGTTP